MVSCSVLHLRFWSSSTAAVDAARPLDPEYDMHVSIEFSSQVSINKVRVWTREIKYWALWTPL